MSNNSDQGLRRSKRLLGRPNEIDEAKEPSKIYSENVKKPSETTPNERNKRKPVPKKPMSTKKIKRHSYDNENVPADLPLSLPRIREAQVLQERKTEIRFVIGIDEAGRGPLAGPVVAAAIHLEEFIPGIIDSKKIGEDAREVLFDTILKSSAVWAVSIVDAAMIDEINILQATLMAMRIAAAATIQNELCELPIHDEASVALKGCYVIRSKLQLPVEARQVHALIDGNRLPGDMDFCSKECLVKGDGREYSIAAASILAKVTRDRLMRKYSKQYPDYRFEKHKGYGTAAHVKAILEHGATPIHRKTFAPLKHLNLDGAK